ncbi:M24 family metallopeptidase [Streptomyces violaceusniger]
MAAIDPAQLLPDPALAREVAAERRERIRTHAAESGLDGVLIHSWRRGAVTAVSGFAAGFVTNTASLWLPVDDEPVLGVRFSFEAERAGEQSGLRTVASVGGDDLRPASARRIGVICGDTAVSDGRAAIIERLSGERVDVADLTSWFDEQREDKSEAEISGLRRAAHVGDLALRAASAAATGDTDFTVAMHVEARARSLGAMRAECLVGFGRGTVVTEPHGATLADGDAIGLELNMVHGGFFSHVQATVLPEEPDDIEARAVDLARRARNAVVSALKPGVPVGAAVRAGDAILESAGLSAAKEYDFGHGIGFDTPEHPRLLTDSDRTIRGSSVVAVHCGLRRPEGETAYTGGPVLVRAAGASDLVDEPVIVVTRTR